MAKTQNEVKAVKAEGAGAKQSTLLGFFGKPKAGPAPTRTPSNPSIAAKPPVPTSSPASTALRTPSSVAGSSPTVVTGSSGFRGRNGVTDSSPVRSTPGTVLKRSTMSTKESDEELTPPPPAKRIAPASSPKEEEDNQENVKEEESMDVDGNDGSPVVSRRAKRKVVYVESDSESSGSDVAAVQSKPKATRKPRKSLKADSDSDDFVFNEEDDIAFAAAADDFEASVLSHSRSPSFRSESPPPKAKKTKGKSTAPKPVPKKSTSSFNANADASSTSRPGPRPLPNESGGGGSSRNSDKFITAAERRKEQAAQERREADDVFEFLKPENRMDKNQNRPGHPDFDERTVYISKRQFEKLSPFETQFWKIKQDHYDTVLFFQKGKFFELYEEDARIGHSEFDLKLTDRVKMAMVGVPEQSFEFWAAKFLAAGYKVGKVEQSETAIGKDMRAKKQGAGKGDKDDKLVRRELAQIFTNGTIVDPTYLTTDEANHCVAIKEYFSEETGLSSFGICVLDASTGEFNLSAFSDDVVKTRLETMFRRIRPKELVLAKGNLSVETSRLLRNILPSNTLWQSFREGTEFCSAERTLEKLSAFFNTSEKLDLPEGISSMVDEPIAMEALGGMLFYLNSLNLDKDLVSQRNFNIYDPIREGKSLVLDGVTLGHMEVLVNNEGGTEGTLLELLQRCQTPSGKRLFRDWLANPLLDPSHINQRLDAVEDLMTNSAFTGAFREAVKHLPDLERHLSRIHAGAIKESDFMKVVDGFETIYRAFDKLDDLSMTFASTTVAGLIRTAPDLKRMVQRIRSLFTEQRDGKTLEILPRDGADEDTDNAKLAVQEIEQSLQDLLKKYKSRTRCPDMQYWHSAQGGKEIYQIQVPADQDVPDNWTKQSGTKNVTRYYNSEVQALIRQLQEARETEKLAKKNFYRNLLGEFDQDRAEWLKGVRIVAELDCLISLAIASHNLDEPKCRPSFVESSHAFIDFEELRHPSMCLRSDFIANDVRLGGTATDPKPRTVLLTGPNMAGKSTLLRMTAAGIIMAQMGCYVPAQSARLSPIDKIQTRMGAYDNLFASASTFKVELDECSKILREAGPKSFVILDELGRGTSTYDGMAIAGAVLHHLATHTLPLAFFATHYGSLTDDYTYHPNICKMHMQTHVDDVIKEVVFLYKLIPGVAESSHGTHVAKMAGVPDVVVQRADTISAEFFDAFKAKLAGRRRSALPLPAQADFVWLLKTALSLKDKSESEMDGDVEMGTKKNVGGLKAQLEVVRKAIGRYEMS